MPVYAWWFNVDLFLFEPNDIRPTIFGCQATDSIPSQVSRKESLRPTDSEPPSRMPNSLMPNAKLRSTNLPSFTSLVWRSQGLNPDLPHPGRSNHYAMRRRSVYLLVCHPGSVGGWIDWKPFESYAILLWALTCTGHSFFFSWNFYPRNMNLCFWF